MNNIIKLICIKKITVFQVFFFFLFSLFSGCAGKHNAQSHNTWDIQKQPIETPPVVSFPEIKENPPILPDKKHIEHVEEKPTDPVHDDTERDKLLPDEKIAMDMKDVDLNLLLRSLAKIAGKSIMISENIKGRRATINIQNEPWNQVFLGVLRTYGLNYEWAGNIIRIISLEDINNEFRQLEIHERKESKKRELESAAPLKNEVIKINFADAENLRGIFEKIISEDKKEKRGSVMVDKHSNTLIIQATQKNIDQMKYIIEKLDQPASLIRIEARIVEATRDTARELGVEWGGIYRGRSKDYLITPGIDTSQESSLDEDTDESSFIPGPGLIQKLPSVLGEASGLNIGFIAQEAGRHILAVQLSALEKQGKLNILSSPSISTLDNQKAVIESGREVPFQTVEDNEVNVEFKKAVLSLEVTPHVINGELLKINIVTMKDELDFSNTVWGNPTVITKKAQTNILLYNGQTTVIGGLKKETDSDSESGVPYLKEIPLFGNLFKKKSRSNNMEEVLIFITPYIIKNDMGR